MRMTHLLFPLTVGLLAVPASAFAAPPDSLMPATAAAAAADKVYPPLPSLAMLPPGGGGSEIEPAPAARTRGSKRKATFVQVRKAADPVPRMVVSEASHTYLAGIEHQLEAALQK
ncbi:hypothetical protein PQH03_14015 [Ralstonia insidiosa]|jgi:hypothetical protein|uniref:hypothetical protein n=1 Tax=Ralstonia TaxID=48736 RepID=UPI000664901D|nr:hypothetical protein [Ralstonia insidiosa]KMW45045.1 hypothetical protein AC240_22580 [Ralstonia sp. MD27]MBX3774126.1 hypothetical protein [Ralstonia pickettii]NOZ15046.1 hypothetical protein [Betaproteobacteria bacterium]MBA9857961.1 hypothetical protein [Ralstonia insidiosa]MBA9871697.1 hypothetical protein [Ralstonia insidiosa]